MGQEFKPHLRVVETTPQAALLVEGVAFFELATADPLTVHRLLSKMGFHPTQRHRRRPLTFYGPSGWEPEGCQIPFLVEHEGQGDGMSFSGSFASAHGTAVCGIGLYVSDVRAILARAEQFANYYGIRDIVVQGDVLETPVHALRGPGDVLFYLIERNEVCSNGIKQDDRPPRRLSALDLEFKPVVRQIGGSKSASGLSHLSQINFQVARGNVAYWSRFFHMIFGLRPSSARPLELLGSKARRVRQTLSHPDHPLVWVLEEDFGAQSLLESYCAHRMTSEGVSSLRLVTEDMAETLTHFWAHKIPLLPQMMEGGGFAGPILSNTPGSIDDRTYDLLVREMARTTGQQPENYIRFVDPVSDINDYPQLFAQTHSLLGGLFFEIIQPLRPAYDGQRSNEPTEGLTSSGTPRRPLEMVTQPLVMG